MPVGTPRQSGAATKLHFGFERDRREWWQLNQNRMFAPHPLSIFALDTAKIANVAAAISFSVGVDDLTIEPGARNAEAIIVTNNRRRVHDEDNHFAFARFSNKRDHAVIGIVKIDPLEAVIGIVLLP